MLGLESQKGFLNTLHKKNLQKYLVFLHQRWATIYRTPENLII